MEIFDGTYMRSRLSPWLSLRAETETLKIGLVSCLKLICGFLIFVPLVKDRRFLSAHGFDYVQASELAFAAK